MTESNSSSQSRTPRSKNTKIAAVLIITVVIVVVALALFSMNNGIGANKYKVTIYIHVTSAHLANVVDINLYADGNGIKSDSISALSTQVYQYDAWFSGSSQNITISGTSQGGGLGDSTDSSTVEVADGGSYNVYLTL